MSSLFGKSILGSLASLHSSKYAIFEDNSAVINKIRSPYIIRSISPEHSEDIKNFAQKLIPYINQMHEEQDIVDSMIYFEGGTAISYIKGGYHLQQSESI
jgi:chitinase